LSISVVPQALLQNIQVQSPDDIYKLNPATRTTTPQASGWSPAATICALHCRTGSSGNVVPACAGLVDL
jgi:hypothetical protein